ncbi:MAG: hypothetical protein JWR21_4374 [Herminiimonas sp.]|nr:hypothetical protein [Herminiimonas sp.]
MFRGLVPSGKSIIGLSSDANALFNAVLDPWVPQRQKRRDATRGQRNKGTEASLIRQCHSRRLGTTWMGGNQADPAQAYRNCVRRVCPRSRTNHQIWTRRIEQCRPKPEPVMVEQTCPKCGARFRSGDAWAMGVLSAVSPAPALRDMATQLRCPRCHHVFASSDVRYLAPWSSRARLFLLTACVGVLAWAVWHLL